MVGEYSALLSYNKKLNTRRKSLFPSHVCLPEGDKQRWYLSDHDILIDFVCCSPGYEGVFVAGTIKLTSSS